MSTSLNDKMKSAKSGNRNPCWRNSRESWFYFHFHFFFFFFLHFITKKPCNLRQNQFPFVFIITVLQVFSSYIKRCRVLEENLFFLFVLFSVFQLPVFSISAHETCGGAELNFSRDQNNNVTSTNQPYSSVRPLLLQRRTKLEEVLACRTGKNVVSIAWKETDGHRCYKAVSLQEFVRNLRVICFVFVSKVAGQNGARLLIVLYPMWLLRSTVIPWQSYYQNRK